MDVDSLPLCVFFTLACVIVGFALIKRSLAFHNLSITYALTNNSRDRVKVEAESVHAERLGTILLFASWLPVTNAAWITDAKCERLQQQVAAIEEMKAEPVSGPATQIAKRDAVQADYQITLQNGATVSWSLNDGTLPGVHRRGWSVNASRSASGARITGSPIAGSDELRNGTSDDGGVVWIGSEQTHGNQTF